MSSVIRSLMVKVGADLSDMQKGLKQASKELKAAGKDLSNMGSGLTKGLTVPIVGAVAGLSGMAIAAGKGADELITLSNKTGLSTQQLQELQYAARFVDVEVETMTGSMQKLTKSMDAAKGGTGAQAEAFEALGINTTNADGSMRDAKDVWIESIGALGGVANETERNALAMNLFGKSAAELNPLIVAGKDELNRLKQEAHDVGAVMSGDNVTALGKFDDSMQKLEAQLKTAGAELGAAFLPVLEKLAPIIEDTIVPALQDAAKFLGQLIEGFSNMSPESQAAVLSLVGLAIAAGPVISVIGGLVTSISGIIAAFSAASGVIAAGGTMMAAVGAFLGPAGIVVVVIAALAAAAYLIISNWDAISAFFTTLWEGVCVAFDAAGVAIGKAIDWVISLPAKVVEFFKNLPYNIGVMLGQFIANFVSFGVKLGTWITTEIPKAIGKIVTFYKELPGKIWTTLTEVVAKIGNWGTNMIGKIQSTIPLVITSITDFFKQLPGKMLQIGKDIVSGIWTGISEKVDWLKTQIGSFGKGITDGIKKALKIESPSKVMRDQVGKFIPAGIADGIMGARGLVDKAMVSLSNGMTVSPNFEAAGGGDVFGGSSTTKLYLDGRQIASATGKVQYTKNKARSRTLGVVPV